MKIPEHLIEKVKEAANNYSDVLESSHRSTETYHPASYYSGCDVGFTAGAWYVYLIAQDEQKKLLDDVIKYCEPHLEQMWAARIVGIILNCDFRDCRSEIEKLKAQRRGENEKI